MKTTLVTLFFAFLFLKLEAQIVFCPAGAEWNYSVTKFNLNLNGPQPETIKYRGDSLVDGENVKVLSFKIFFKRGGLYNTSLSLIKQTGDTVWMRNSRTQHNWQVLYNFSALPGEKWTNTLIDGVFSTPINYTVTVDSVNSVTINGLNLKRMVLNYKTDLWYLTGAVEKRVVLERAGADLYLFNFGARAGADAPYVNQFLCYRDSAFGLKQFSSTPCNLSVGVYEFNLLNISFSLYPNPTKNEFTIDNYKNSGPFNITLTDLNGIIVGQWTMDSEKFVVDIGDIRVGAYFLTILKNGRQQLKTKLFKIE